VYLRVFVFICMYPLGVHGGLSVACYTARREVRGSNPGQGRNLDQDFCSMSTTTLPLRPQEPAQSLELA